MPEAPHCPQGFRNIVFPPQKALTPPLKKRRDIWHVFSVLGVCPDFGSSLTLQKKVKVVPYRDLFFSPTGSGGSFIPATPGPCLIITPWGGPAAVLHGAAPRPGQPPPRVPRGHGPRFPYLGSDTQRWIGSSVLCLPLSDIIFLEETRRFQFFSDCKFV